MIYWVIAAFFTGFYLGLILFSLLTAASKGSGWGCVCHPGIAEDWNSPEDDVWDSR